MTATIISGCLILLGTLIYIEILSRREKRYEAYLKILDIYAKKEWRLYRATKLMREAKCSIRSRGRRLPDQIALR